MDYNYADDCSLFVGLTTMPFSKESNFIEEVQALIDGYKKKQEEFSQIHSSALSHGDSSFEEFKNMLYVPRVYMLFGNYDLAVLSLIDDYTLTNRNFHPYSYFVSEKFPEREHSEKFNYQIITGPTPLLENVSENNYRHKLLEKASKTFLKKQIWDVQNKSVPSKSLLPLIGICRLKLNNGLLIGAGAGIVSLVEHTICQIVEESNVNNLEFIISESFGWHELTIVFFSDCYIKIKDLIFSIRKLKLEDVNFFRGQASVYYDLAKENSLLARFLDKEKSGKGGAHFSADKSHLFVKTLTTFGYDYELIGESYKKGSSPIFPSEFLSPNIIDESLELVVKWDVKPGHLQNLIREINGKESQDYSISNISGQEDVIFPEKTKLSDYFNIVHESIFVPQDGLKRKAEYHFRKINTYLKFKNHPSNGFQKSDYVDESNHYYFSKNLKSFSFSLDDLKKIRKKLYKCNVSKILREKVLNMYVNYNDGIQDSQLYIYFIELRNFLEKVQMHIYDIADDKNDEYRGLVIHEELSKHIESFDHAFKNRFHQSYRMDGVTDFNMEYNGGCQQIISAFDGAYKVISSTFGEGKNPNSFVIVTGHSGVDTSISNMRINYFHIFQPSIFIAPIIKESMNKFFDKLEYQLSDNKVVNKVFENSAYIPDYKDFWGDEDFIINAHDHKYCKVLKEKNRVGESKIIKYFRSDLITFLYGFNLDEELFKFWFWNYFMQMSNAYNKHGEIEEIYFIRHLLRYFMLFEFINPGMLEKGGEFSEFNSSPNIQLSSLWSSHYVSAKRYVNSLLNDSIFKKWLSNILLVGLTQVLGDNSTSEVSRYKVGKRLFSEQDMALINKVKSLDMDNSEFEFSLKTGALIGVIDRNLPSNPLYNSADYAVDRTLLTMRYTYVKCNYALIKDKFEKGEIYEFNHTVKGEDGKLREKNYKPSPALYLQSISYAYLKCLYDDFMSSNGNSVLFRNKSDSFNSKGEVLDFVGSDFDDLRSLNNKLLFDPMGGLFSVDFKTRRKYYKYRSTFIKSLWDLSLKLKVNLFMGSTSSQN